VNKRSPHLLVIDRGLFERGMLTIEQARDSWGWNIVDIATVGEASEVEVRKLIQRVPTSILAVGGGTTLDVAKLAGWIGDDEVRLRDAFRSVHEPYRILPDAPPRCPVVATATTFGTGAENNRKVSIRNGSANLVMYSSRGLRPRQSGLWPQALCELPASLVAAGLGEILFRLLGPALESHSDRNDETICGLLNEVLFGIAEFARGRLDEASPHKLKTLQRMAGLGAQLHARGMFDISQPFVGLPWFLGRAVQEMLPSVQKMDAILDAWVRLAYYFESDVRDAKYLSRWTQLRERANMMQHHTMPQLPWSLVHLLFNIRKALRVDWCLVSRYPGVTSAVQSKFEKDWSELTEADPRLCEGLSRVYQIHLRDIYMVGGEFDGEREGTEPGSF